MLRKRDHAALYKQLEELQRTRVANLRKAMQSAGDWDKLGKVVGMSAAFLRQMGGECPQRALGEKLARKLEILLGVPLGWLDQRH